MEPKTNEQAWRFFITVIRFATSIVVKMWQIMWQYIKSTRMGQFIASTWNEIDKTDRVKICIGVVGVLVTFLGFWVAYTQLSLLNKSTKAQYLLTKAQTWQALMQLGVEIQKAFIEHPELRPYFYEKKPFRREDKNYQAVATIAEMYLDWFDSFGDDYVAELPEMGPNGEQRKMWEKFFKDMFKTSEALQDMAKEKVREQWYSADLLKYMLAEDAATTDTSNMPTEATSQ